VLEYSQSVLGIVDEATSEQLTTLLKAMSEGAEADLEHEGIDEAQRVFTPSLDLRYQGQAYELNMPYDTELDIADFFHATHKSKYGHALYGRSIEVVNLRLRAMGIVSRPEIVPEALQDTPALPIGQKTTVTGEVLSLYNREALLPGMQFDGGVLVFQLDSTIYIPAGWRAAVDAYRNLILTRE